MPDRLNGIFESLRLIYEMFRMPIICPMHPRTKQRIEKFGFKVPSGLKLLEPLGFLDFFILEANASLDD